MSGALTLRAAPGIGYVEVTQLVANKPLIRLSHRTYYHGRECSIYDQLTASGAPKCSMLHTECLRSGKRHQIAPTVREASITYFLTARRLDVYLLEIDDASQRRRNLVIKKFQSRTRGQVGQDNVNGILSENVSNIVVPLDSILATIPARLDPWNLVLGTKRRRLRSTMRSKLN